MLLATRLIKGLSRPEYKIFISVNYAKIKKHQSKDFYYINLVQNFIDFLKLCVILQLFLSLLGLISEEYT